MPPHTLNLRVSHLRAQIERTSSVRDDLEKLNSAPKTLSGNRQYRFTTFTAHHGSSVHEQLKDLKAHAKTGLTARGGDFPHITDAALKRAVPKNQEVPKGEVTQYFCYVTNANRGELVATFTMPKHLADKDRRISTVRHPDMVRQGTFKTDAVERYVDYLDTQLTTIESKLEADIEDHLVSGALSYSGPEMAVRSATDLNSSGGVLVSLGPDKEERELPVYCPECFETVLQRWQGGLIGNTLYPTHQRLPFPPIPITSIELTVYCTENKHKEHGLLDCVDLNYVNDRLNDYRASLGVDPHSFTLLSVNNKDLSRRLGRWVWLDF